MTRSLTVLAGFPGVGKTFIGRELAALEGSTVFEADSIRKELSDGNPTYSGEESQRVYDTLFSRGRSTLEDGESAILDATFGLQYGRRSAESLANDFNARFRLVHVVCDETTTKNRLRQRTNTASDADATIYDHIKQNFEPFERDAIEIDNAGSRERTIHQLQHVVRS